MKQQHNKGFIVMMILVASLFIWFQAHQILHLEIAYLDQSLPMSTGFVYLGLLLYIPLAFFIVLYLPSRLLFRGQLRWTTQIQLQKKKTYNHQIISIPVHRNRTITYQVFRC